MTEDPFNNWYLEFREEMVKRVGVDYVISIISWTFSENHRHYYEKGYSPAEAAGLYMIHHGKATEPVAKRQKLRQLLKGSK